jgi:hypothetical protein
LAKDCTHPERIRQVSQLARADAVAPTSSGADNEGRREIALQHAGFPQDTRNAGDRLAGPCRHRDRLRQCDGGGSRRRVPVGAIFRLPSIRRVSTQRTSLMRSASSFGSCRPPASFWRCWLIERVRFAHDSPLEGDGFELSVPLAKERRFRPLNHAEFVDDHPFRISDWGEFHTLPRNHVSSRDRDFRPARRRDFDDDNFETPRRSFGSTSGSSIQRFEAPPGPPVQAVVK